MEYIELVDELCTNHTLSLDGYRQLLESNSGQYEYLRSRACEVRQAAYGRDVYVRGLIEISSYCRNNCRYCGIRRDNGNAIRYRLKQSDIMECVRTGYKAGIRTFVLQGGEDGYYTDDVLVSIIGSIRNEYPDCAVTLSLGERSYESYSRLYQAGAERYLLRHETASKEHYGMLHPGDMSYDNRIRCLRMLKDIGYQTGCGMMVGSPGQTVDMLIEDLRLIEELHPQMVGMGPFIPHKDTEYRNEEAGSAELTLRLLSIVRLIDPYILLPATTALATVEADGRERGILAGANVVMPNLSPSDVRKCYSLYDNKADSGAEAIEGINNLRRIITSVGYSIVSDRGDYKGEKRNV